MYANGLKMAFFQKKKSLEINLLNNEIELILQLHIPLMTQKSKKWTNIGKCVNKTSFDVLLQYHVLYSCYVILFLTLHFVHIYINSVLFSQNSYVAKIRLNKWLYTFQIVNNDSDNTEEQGNYCSNQKCILPVEGKVG